jgi:hypothetical protein
MLFKDIIKTGNGSDERPVLNGAYIGEFLGVVAPTRDV